VRRSRAERGGAVTFGGEAGSAGAATKRREAGTKTDEFKGQASVACAAPALETGAAISMQAQSSSWGCTGAGTGAWP